MSKSNENMELWESVETTDPEFTKRVNQRGGFTAIGAQYQLREATKKWGPYGGKWGVRNCHYGFIYRLQTNATTSEFSNKETLGDPIEAYIDAVFYYPGGEFEISTDIAFKTGNDTRKKLLTDLTTKGLSKLGFNADVFMGKFDDNKYVESLGGKPPQASDTNKPLDTGSLI